ncbi:hypothetical protein BH09ACT12_BH09ACT12_10090 [soil metagenome]
MAGESEWYETQIGRLGDGLDVTASLHPARAASSFIGGELVRGLRGSELDAASPTDRRMIDWPTDR